MENSHPDPNPSGQPNPLWALARIARGMAGEPHPAQALWNLVCALCEDLHIDRAGVFAYDAAENTLDLITGVDLHGAPEFGTNHFPVSNEVSPLMQVARRDIPHYFSNRVREEFPHFEWAPAITTHAIVPILAGDRLMGTLNVDNGLTSHPIPESTLTPLFLYAGLAALPLFALYQRKEREREEELRRSILREMIQAVTGGKVTLCGRDEIVEEWPPMDDGVAIEKVEDVPAWRDRVREIALHAGMEGDRARDFELCASEAATNALLHGNGGTAAVGRVETRLRVRVVDRGTGIDADQLPPALLQPGASTGRSAGLGYTLIIEMSDRVFLHTGPDGTTLIVEMGVEPELSFPESWDDL